MSIVEEAMAKMHGNAAAATGSYGKVVEGARRDGGTAPHPIVPSRMLAVDQSALHAVGILPPKHQERQIASQYRQIKRPLIASAFGRERPSLPRGRLIMIGSAVPGEGKTFTSINLAFSMAREKDVHVLLVDADVHNPQTGRTFGIAGERGLIDALVEPGTDIESLVFGTDVPNLSVLPAGTRGDTELATELFASERMLAVLQDLLRRDPRRIVLFDSSPLLVTTESRELASIVGQIVVVIRADRTEQGKVEEALSYLPEAGKVSLILNQCVAMEESAYYYGYGTGAQPQESR
jgi:protein-tyrosine kinase